jgi:hypothetical protein
MVTLSTARVLARCNGFTVVADGEVVGRVATPVFSGTRLLPDYLLVRLAESIPGRYCAIPTALIGDADAESETVGLEIGVDEIRLLTEQEG